MQAVLYTWPTCSFCRRAKQLLDEHGVAWTERALDRTSTTGRTTADRLARELGHPTMPYVFLDGELIGGLAELERMAAEGELG